MNSKIKAKCVPIFPNIYYWPLSPLCRHPTKLMPQICTIFGSTLFWLWLCKLEAICRTKSGIVHKFHESMAFERHGYHSRYICECVIEETDFQIQCISWRMYSGSLYLMCISIYTKFELDQIMQNLIPEQDFLCLTDVFRMESHHWVCGNQFFPHHQCRKFQACNKNRLSCGGLCVKVNPKGDFTN